MANVIIGTAGHIDHGKTTLIRALTGIETDRLKEEKKRGITIELGFAYFDLPSGRRAGIVDVPGHEKFIKNMLAGVIGIDLVLFIVAADEGVMPQTVEHIDILNILGVEKGIIVITKSDLVDEEMLYLVEEEIIENIKGTVLENSEIISISAVTGENIDKLIKMIDEKTNEIKKHNQNAPFRLNIDRVFTLKGHGTIVTGTLIEGKINVNDEIEIYPKGIMTKARSIQVHEKTVDTAYAGQRTAINLPGLKVDDLERGDIVSKPGSLTETSMIDVKLELIDHSKRILKHGSRVRFYHGTHETICRLILLNDEEIKPGEEVFAQFRFSKPIACKYGDRFVMRFYSPVETIGGGVILNPNTNKHKRFSEEVINEMLLNEKGSIKQLIESFLLSEKDFVVKLSNITRQLGEGEDEILKSIDELIVEGVFVEIIEHNYIHQERLNRMIEQIIEIINDFHDSNPLIIGIGKGEIKNKFFKKEKKNIFDALIKYFIENNIIEESKGKLYLKGFEIKLNEKQKKRVNEIHDLFIKAKYKPPTYKSLGDFFSKEDYQLLDLLINEGALIKINQEIFFESSVYLSVKSAIIKYIEDNNSLTIKDLKDLIDISRKYSVPLLEHFDEVKVTKRMDNHRVLY